MASDVKRAQRKAAPAGASASGAGGGKAALLQRVNNATTAALLQRVNNLGLQNANTALLLGVNSLGLLHDILRKQPPTFGPLPKRLKFAAKGHVP